MSLAHNDQTPTFDQANRLLSDRLDEQKQCEREVAIIKSEVERITQLYEEKEAQLRNAEASLWSKKVKGDTGVDQTAATLAMETERRRQEQDRNVRELIHTMVKKRIQLAPQGSVGAKEEVRYPTLFVHSVKVNYIKNLKDGDIERFTKAMARTAVFRITKDTTLMDLRKTVCDFWVSATQGIAHPEIMSLRAINMAYLELLAKEERVDRDTMVPLYRLFGDNKLFPELWLIENNSHCSQLFPNQEDFCKFRSR